MTYPYTKAQKQFMFREHEYNIELAKELLFKAKQGRDALVKLPYEEDGVSILHGSNMTVARIAKDYYTCALVLTINYSNRYEREELFKKYGFRTNGRFYDIL